MAEPVPENVALGLRRLVALADDEILGWAPDDHPDRVTLEPAIEWIEELLNEWPSNGSGESSI